MLSVLMITELEQRIESATYNIKHIKLSTIFLQKKKGKLIDFLNLQWQIKKNNYYLDFFIFFLF